MKASLILSTELSTESGSGGVFPPQECQVSWAIHEATSEHEDTWHDCLDSQTIGA
jgi:hypothetical protein